MGHRSQDFLQAVTKSQLLCYNNMATMKQLAIALILSLGACTSEDSSQSKAEVEPKPAKSTAKMKPGILDRGKRLGQRAIAKTTETSEMALHKATSADGLRRDGT